MFSVIVRDNIRRHCVGKWRQNGNAETLAIAVARITGRSTGLHSLENISKAFNTGVCSMLLLRDIAKALDTSMDDLLPNDTDHRAGDKS
jgi:hypothetical protein